MTILLVALGSAGDVHPNIGLALELKRRGHRAILMAGVVFQELASQVGLEFVSAGTREQYDRALRNPDLWHPTRAFNVVARQLILPAMREVYAQIERLRMHGKLIVTAPATALGARIAQEALGVPLATIHLQPSMLRSVYENPVFSVPDLTSSAPRFFKNFYFRLVDWLMIDSLLGKDVNQFRAELGLPPVRRIFDQWMHSPELTLGLFPESFANPQPDGPRSVRLTGFPLYDERNVRELPEDLAAFLDEGKPPIVFTAGSAMTQGSTFFRESVKLCQTLDERGILLAQHPEQIPNPLPEGIRHFAYVPFSEVLPRAAVLVHHGGIGTTAQALAAGVPQLVVPMAHDQPDNAVRVKRLAVGLFVPAFRYRERTTRPLIEALLRDPRFRHNAQRFAATLDGNHSISAACDLIESLQPGS